MMSLRRPTRYIAEHITAKMERLKKSVTPEEEEVRREYRRAAIRAQVRRLRSDPEYRAAKAAAKRRRFAEDPELKACETERPEAFRYFHDRVFVGPWAVDDSGVILRITSQKLGRTEIKLGGVASFAVCPVFAPLV